MSVETVRYYTRGRKFPVMFGKFSDGTRIWGGPYTSTQFIGGGASFLVLWTTMRFWAHFGLLNLVILMGVPAGIMLALRSVRMDRRNPFSVLMSVVSAYSQPESGKLRGRSVTGGKPKRVRARVVVTASAAPDAGVASGRASEAASAFAVETRSVPASGPVPAPQTRPAPAPTGALGAESGRRGEVAGRPLLTRSPIPRPAGGLSGVARLRAARIEEERA